MYKQNKKIYQNIFPLIKKVLMEKEDKKVQYNTDERFAALSKTFEEGYNLV